ncbi:tRNA pseudouridine(38-40) synthase TruA [Halovivax cerinus]|uniref:tRNA pseudouridine synthase A n=1 Tax=Halovivax cerinus TaxID=1487865 RepID=A0ABD5NST3_9EURY|nr:tRNA pseudouridine(38-40) synthase TruA [Halovivax cerinus]
MRAYRLAYDGRDYRGFQRQPDVDTVEDALFDALRSLDAYRPAGASAAAGGDSLDEPVPDRPLGYAAAGRTDAGVSALAQTVAFCAPEWLTPRALNAELPADVRAWASADVANSFHATHDATARTYTYHLYAPAEAEGEEKSDSSTGRSGPTTIAETVAPTDVDERRVDDDRLREATDALSGTHDYHNLTPDDEGTERTLSLAAERDGEFVVLTVRAGGFARQLVRRLVTLVHRVGTGEASVETIDRVLDPEPVPGHEGIPPAPPDPLVLADVTYPDVDFAVDAEAARSARAVFERTRRDHATGARVAERLRDGVR